MLFAAARTLLYHTGLTLIGGREAFREAQEREFRLQQSQLQLLKAQFRPHFLFNTLNTIAQLINEHPEAAEKMVLNLSGMPRLSLAQTDEQEVTLARDAR